MANQNKRGQRFFLLRYVVDTIYTISLCALPTRARRAPDIPFRFVPPIYNMIKTVIACLAMLAIISALPLDDDASAIVPETEMVQVRAPHLPQQHVNRGLS